MSGPVDRAIAKVLAEPDAKPARLAQVTIRVTTEPLRITSSGELSFSRGEKSPPALASLLVWDPDVGAFRPVLTPPGSSWELVQKAQGPQLWKPGLLP